MRTLALILLASMLTSPGYADARVETLDGRTYRGKLEALDAKEVAIGGRRVALQDIISLEFDGAARQAGTRFEMLTGDVYVGKLLGSDDDLDSLSVSCDAVKGTIKLNTMRLKRLTYPTNAQERKRLKPLLPEGDSDAIQLRNGDTSRGELISVERADGQLTFIFGVDDDELTIRESTVHQLLLFNDPADQEPVNDKVFHAVVRCWDGTRIAGKLLGYHDRIIKLETLAGAKTLALPLAGVRSVEFRNGRFVYLSDRTWSKKEVTPYFSRRFEPRLDRCRRGGPLTLRGVVYPKGIGMQSKTRLTYDVRGFSTFRCLVGIDDAAGDGGSVICRVYLDGKQVKQTEVLRGGGDPLELKIKLGEASTMTIETDFADNAHVNDLASWARAVLVRD